MCYTKSVFFIPVWFDQFEPFTKALEATSLWQPTEPKKLWACYLFHYAAGLNREKKLFASYTLKDPAAWRVYMFRDELQLETEPTLEEVRYSCFATGVGFLEFWISYPDWTAEQVADFAFQFKKATKKRADQLPEGQYTLYDAAQALTPKQEQVKLFFSQTAKFKYECNCFHFLHLDQPIPDQDTLQATMYRLSRSYQRDMPAAEESSYDILYKAGEGDYWSGSPEGLANVVYDFQNDDSKSNYYYLHTAKPQRLQQDYYFMYLLLLNQKYTAVEYIRNVARFYKGSSLDVESLNRRIVMLKSTFSFNIISDDSIVQNIYTRMYGVLEIRNLLEDLIENEKQLEILQNAKYINADRFSNKYLLGISILSLFSALIDAASYFDRWTWISDISNWLSFSCVFMILVLCVTLALRGDRK